MTCVGFLEQVHERQTARMRTRSEWFLGGPVATHFPVREASEELILEDAHS